MANTHIFSHLGALTDIGKSETWSSEEFAEKILGRKKLFLEYGFTPGDRVLIIHENNNDFFADLLALWALSCCPVCVSSDVGLMEFDHIVVETKARFGICKHSVPQKLTPRRDSFKFLTSGTCTSTENSSDDLKSNSHFDLDAEALILFTSGTTGTPKGVVHTFRSLKAKWKSLDDHLLRDATTRSLCLLPTTFGHGLICNCLYPLMRGDHLFVAPKSDISTMGQLGAVLDRYDISFMSSVPAIWRYALKFSASPKKKTVRLITCGSAPLDSTLWQSIRKWSGTENVWNVYGITETGSWIGGGPRIRYRNSSGTIVGKPWGAVFAISSEACSSRESQDNEDRLELVPSGEVGHVWVKTDSLMRGYLNHPDLTSEVISGSWFSTGDTGYLLDTGELVLSGRSKTEVNVAGLKVAPEQVDLILAEHPRIIDCCTFGIADPISGQKIGVACQFDEPITNRTKSELATWCKQRLADYKVPAIWFSVDRIPRDSRGKLNRETIALDCLKMQPIR